MTSIELMEQCLLMLKRQGFRPKNISALAGELKVEGLEPLPPTLAEEASEATESKLTAERKREDKRLLGIV